MKFARYLEDTQTPEWKRAYIDYRRLKKCITQIRESKSPSIRPSDSPSTFRRRAQSTSNSAAPAGPGTSPNAQSQGRPPASPFSFVPSRHGEGDRLSDRQQPTYGSSGRTPPLRTQVREPSPPLEELPPPMQDLPKPVQGSNSLVGSQSLKRFTTRGTGLDRHQSSPNFRTSPRAFPLGTLRRRASARTGGSGPNVFTLDEIYRTLKPVEMQFFDALDEELLKVERFYLEREKDALIFSSMLNEQLRELQTHRKIYHEAQDGAAPWDLALDALTTMKRILPGLPEGGGSSTPQGRSKSRQREELDLRLDPDQYHHHKRKLKKAILEHYHGIELLNNYRILNLTGFRKALKKFEKQTKIPAQQAYTSEKIEGCLFASDAKITEMIKDVEKLYATHYTNGNKKTARDRLRGALNAHTQHTRSFRSGLYVGLGIPALIRGIYLSFEEETRTAIPAWAPLLQIYGGFMIPVVFVMLIALNMIVWKRFRINYVFIFEFDVRTAIDPRELIEIPAFLFLTLCYAILLTFSRVGAVAPTTWPIAWLVFAILFILDPIPFVSRSSRYWFIKKCAKLLTSGSHRVEFADFWLGDQFCSLAFSLSTLWTLGCSMENDWKADSWSKCGLSNHWPTPFVLSCLPSLIRFAQCLKRYADSGLYTHLINGGKYLSSILYYVLYYIWRHQGAKHQGASFGLFIMGGLMMSIYTSSWDLLMDWSVLKLKAEHKFIRPEIIYTGFIPSYYFAMFTNVFVRFIWVWFFIFPSTGLNITARSFIFGVVEMLRRVQWNFFRLENEHLGNMDQYRVTREIPLPYTLAEDVDDDIARSDKWSLRRLRKQPAVPLPEVSETAHDQPSA